MEPSDGERKRGLSASGLDSSAEPTDNPPTKQHRSAGPKKAFLMSTNDSNLSTSMGDSQPESTEEQRTQQYQQRAMSLRLQELKREVSTTEAKLKLAEEKQQEQDRTLATINTCWKQLHRDLLVTLAKLDPFLTVQEPEVDGKKALRRSKTFLGALLSASDVADAEASDAAIRESLKKRMDFTQSLMEKIFGALEVQREHNAKLAEMLRAEAIKNGNEELAKDNEAQRAVNAKLQEALDAFQVKYRKTSAELDEAHDIITAHEQTLTKLRNELDDTTSRLEIAERKLDKLQQGERLKPPKQEMKKELYATVAAAVPAASSAAVKKESENSGGSEADKEKITELELQIAELRTFSDHRHAEIAKLREEKTAALQHINRLQGELSSMAFSDERVAKSRLYSVLKAQCASLHSEAEAARFQSEGLRNHVNVLEARDELTKLRDHDSIRIQQLERDVRDANERASRLKKDRDAYAHRFHEKCAEQPNQATVDEYKRLIASQERELKQLRPEIDRMKAELTAGTKRTEGEEALLAELETISKTYEEGQDQIQRLLRQLGEKEDTSIQYLKERKQNEQIVAALRQEKDMLTERNTKLADKTAAQTNLIAQLESKNRLAQEAAAKSLEEIKSLQNLAEMTKRVSRDASTALAEAKSQVEHLSSVQQDVRKQLDEATAAAERAQERNSRLEEENTALRKKLEKLAERTKGGLDKGLQHELEEAKRKLICSVCREHYKDTVIAKCFHVFCRPCIKRNLEVRLRKCPSCGKSFGDNDVQSIFLDFE